MERKVMKDLLEWKNNPKRKPLLIYGARQVGKTYLMKEFGEKAFENTIYVNFETDSIVSKVLEEDITPDFIIKNLEIIFNQRIDKKNTLIIFDEIQANKKALTSLKYFCEDAPEYHIIGAGSLLGVRVNKKDSSFPVGKVEFLTIYPMSFDEFLMNTDNELLLTTIKDCYKQNKKMSEPLHEKAIELYYHYLIIGGMPEVVQEYIDSNSIVSAINYQSAIIDSYKSDITKYCENVADANKIIATFDSIPIQLAKDNKKFQYKLVQKGGTSSIFGDSIMWLFHAGIVNKCIKTKIGIPLHSYEEEDSFKLYMNDIGLLTNLSEFPIYLIKNMDTVKESIIGMLCENYVASCLKLNGINLNYWKSDYDSEVDFILQSENGLIIPLEVKAGIHTKSKSLNSYIKEFNPKYSIRVSLKNFGWENNIKSIPLYAVFCITKSNLDEME